MKDSHPHTGRPKKNFKRKYGIAFIGILLACAILITGLVLAKYVQKWKSDPMQADAKAFYFTSDLLRDPSENASYVIDAQTQSLRITLSNAEDSQKITAEDIKYEVKVSGGSIDAASGTIAGGAENTAELLITPDGKAESITVRVSSTLPYARTLSAAFLLAPANQYTVEDEAGNTAAVLTITCTGANQDIVLALPSGVIPDATDGRVSAANGGYLFHAPGKGVYSLVLLKTNTAKNYSCAQTAFADQIKITG